MSKVEKLKKEEKENPGFQALVDQGIPVKVAIFHRPVQSMEADDKVGIPEHALYAYESNPIKSRRADMYYTPAGLLLIQKHGKTIVPLANVVFARLK